MEFLNDHLGVLQNLLIFEGEKIQQQVAEYSHRDLVEVCLRELGPLLVNKLKYLDLAR